VLLIVFSGVIIGSRFLGKSILFGPTDRSQARSASGTAETVQPSHSSPPTNLPAQKEKNQETGSPTNVMTSGIGNFPAGSKWVILFGYDTNELPPESLSRLDELAGQLLLKTDLNIVIKGYTDSFGSTEYNRTSLPSGPMSLKATWPGKGSIRPV